MVSAKTWVAARSDPQALLVWPVPARQAPEVPARRVRVRPLGLAVLLAAAAVLAVALVVALEMEMEAFGLGPAAAATRLAAALVGYLRDQVDWVRVIEVLGVWALVYWQGRARATAATTRQAARAAQCSPPSQCSQPARTPPVAPPSSPRPRMRDPQVSILRDLRPNETTKYH